MPQNKNFQKRIAILDACFASRTGVYTLDRLNKVIEEKSGVYVHERTIQNDIKFIKETIENNLSAEIDFEENPIFIKKIFEGKKKIFKYSDKKFALGNQLLSSSDQEQLEETLALLSRYKNREDFSWLNELFPRIESAFSLAHEDYNGLISYQSNRDYSGQSWLGQLYNQLILKKVLTIEYKDFKSHESYKRIIHPYHLKQYNSRWFLFGLEEGERYTGITNLALDRILNITETTETIKKDTTNWGDYFDEFIGVTKIKNEKPLSIKLRFSKKRIGFVTTKPIHGASQRLDKSDSEERTIIINVIPNNELYQTLLSFGSDLEVLEPKIIVDELHKIINEMKENYK
jgi:predicted DNA-binding transcriptional regulator YafY